MNKKIYRQYDSRWGNLPYPSKPYTLSRSGCGCVAVTHCAIERDKYKNYTPKDVRKFMVKYATKGQGTLWNGITKGLEHYGYNVHWRQADTMKDIYKVLSKSLKRGVILFGSTKGPDGTVWTTDGHFIAFTAYKIEKGKHWFYLKDSGGRKHDGWYCYEKSMKGDVRQVWICTSIKSAPKSTTTAKKTTTSTKTSTAKKTTSTAAKKAPAKKVTSQQKLIAKMKELAWAYGTAKKKYAYKTGAPKAVCKKAMKKYGWADNKAEMSDCGNFVSTVVRESGVDKSFKALHGTKTPFPKTEKKFKIVLKGKKVPKDFLKAGDIIRYKKKNGNQHTQFYFGNGKVCEASHHNRFGAIVKDEKKYNNSKIAKISTVQVLRAKG